MSDVDRSALDADDIRLEPGTVGENFASGGGDAGVDEIGDLETKEYVVRGAKRFERRTSARPKALERTVVNVHVDERGFFTRLCCGKDPRADIGGPEPDADFHADCLVKLGKGVCAYRFTEPSTATDENADTLPIVVCLHGMTNSSYMWADVVDLLCDSDQGPQARVLVFDFYGRGRSPWSGVPITLDVLVTQTKELLDFLGLDSLQVSLIGYDLGAAVATGFAAKYPSLCASLVLVSPIGVRYEPVAEDSYLFKKYFGEYLMANGKRKLIDAQLDEFYQKGDRSPAKPLIDKQTNMVKWQINNTAGYLGSLLSTYRLFPLRGMEELYTAVGRHPRAVMVVWGDQDEVCTYRPCIHQMEKSFPSAPIVDIKNAGHNCIFEKFDEVVTEILCFHKELYNLEEEEEENRTN